MKAGEQYHKSCSRALRRSRQRGRCIFAQKAGLEVLKYSVPSTNEIKTSMSVMTKKVDAVFVPQDNTIASAFRTVIVAANQANIPVYSSVDTRVEQGSIASVAQSQYCLELETAKEGSQLKMYQSKLLIQGSQASI